jgi:Bacterial Ig domain/Putative Ig domain
MMKRLRRTLWHRLSRFWDYLFLACEDRLTLLAKCLGVRLEQRHDDRRTIRTYLSLEALEPRWVLSPVAVNDSYSVLHGQVLTISSPSLGLLANDSDTGDLTLTVTGHSGVSHGTVSVNTDGTFTYTPTTGYTGYDSFNYTITDGTLTASATVTIDVTDQAPVAVNASYSVPHGQTLTVSSPSLGLLAGDSDADGDTLTVTGHSAPAHGTVSVNADGTFTYTPTTSYAGYDSFTYAISDGALSASAEVTIDVTDRAPVAVNDSYLLLENHTLTASSPSQGVLANDSDPDGDTLTVTGHTSSADGTVSVNADGTFSYVPTTGYIGHDDFTYWITDGALSAQAEVTIDVGNPPVAVADSYQIMQDHTLTVSAAWRGLLSNDTNASADTLTLTLPSTPSHGTVSVDTTDGTFTYTPTTGYVGTDGFTYAIANPFGSSSTTVTIDVASNPTITVTQSPPPAPILTAPGSQTNTEGDSVSLDVTASDPNGYALQYAADNLPGGLTINSSTGVISGTVVAESADYNLGIYDVTVIVANSDGGSTSGGFTWTIDVAPPIVTNPGSQTNDSGDNVSLQISASQYDGDPLDYEATNLPDGLSLDPDSGLISGTVAADAISSTPYSVTVTVTDDTPATPVSTSQTFNWSIGAGNPTPTFTNPGAQFNSVGDYVDLTLNATDPGGYPLTVTDSGLPSGLSIDPGSGEITGTIANSAASTTPYSVTVTASDGQASDSQTFNWTVSGVILTNPGDQTNLDSDTVSLAVTASDAGGGTLSYSASGLPSGLTINTSTGVISGTISSTADASSPDTVTVTASDGSANATQTFNWEVDRLTLNAPNNQSNVEGTSVSLSLSAGDGVGTPTFSASGLPSGLTLNASTGVISGTLGDADHGQSPYQVTVTATDGSASDSQSFVWTVTPQVALQNPGSQGNAAGDSVSLALTGQDLSSGTLTYSAGGLPGGLSINASTGVISGTLSSGDASGTPYAVTVTAGDGTYSSSQTFSWTVSTIALPSPGDQDNLDDDTVSLSLAASYHGSGTLSYSASGLPDGLSLNTSTGLISGTLSNTADADGPYTTTVTATDGSASATLTINWEVDPRVTVDSIDDQMNVPGDSVSFAAVSAEDASSDSVTWTYSASGLPAGLSIDSTTGIISGTLTATVGASDTVTVTASDGIGSASQTFTWNVVPVVLNNPDNQANVGSTSITLALSADVASGYTASYSASGLPPGLSLNSSTGVISGTFSSSQLGSTVSVEG